MKFAHIADTHIRNLKFHYEYKAVFNKMYEILREQEVDYIVHCGDIAHTKTQISPEFVQMAADFFTNLAAIAPTYIILGNHDGNLKNSNRQDALSPIIDALSLQHLHLLKNAGETNIDDKHCLNVLSVFDEDNWVSPSDDSKINIALYHGSVSGVTTDTGWVMEHGEHPVSIFEGHDFAFLGDIHKTNQILDTEGRVRYCGSTVQQNHGETNDKGFLIWDIQSKDDFTVEHHILENPKPFVTINLTPKGRIPRGTEVSAGARLRLVANHNISLDRLKKAVDISKKRYNPESITFLNRCASERGSVEVGDALKENLRDVAVQESLIREFLNDYEVEPDMIEDIYSINRHYNSSVESEEEVQRNVRWSLKTLEWDNLFNYGEGNKVDFAAIGGIVGIFGKNFSGKSSIIDSLLWTLFNSTSKRNRKSLDIINQNTDHGRGKVEILVGNSLLTVERKSEKYVKKLRGEETVEAKTYLNFEAKDIVTGQVTSLNGETRNNTDKNIRKYFGTLEDFLLTSMSSQLESLLFIGEGSTKRKEILAKFLDLEFFEKKYRLCKDETTDMRGAIKRLEETDYAQEILETIASINTNSRETKGQQATCDSLRGEVAAMSTSLEEVSAKIEASPEKLINIKKVRAALSKTQTQMDTITTRNESLRNKLTINNETLQKIKDLEQQFDAPSYEEKLLRIKLLASQVKTIEEEINRAEVKKGAEEKKIELLNSVPCGKEFSHCQFIRDAYTALEQVGITKEQIESLSKDKSLVSDELVSLEPTKVEDHLEKYNKVLDKKNSLIAENAQIEVEIAKNESQLVTHEASVSSHNQQIETYDKNKKLFDNLDNLMEQKNNFVTEIAQREKQIEKCQESVMSFYRESGSLEQKLENLRNQEEELADLRKEYAARDLFMSCMHSNGISLDIIKRELPRINEEIAKVLANVVDFEVFMENDEKRLDILIKHPKFDPRPLEMGSGAEKSIAAMAIRLALLNVSSMPKGDLFIMDEPGTALDEDNMEGFIRIIDLVKSSYKSVLLISHLDTLKDSVDTQISIERKGKFASVNQ